jgi:hypothetical protein
MTASNKQPFVSVDKSISTRQDYAPLVLRNDSFKSKDKENSDDFIINPLLALQR